jgi:hypothetical protein
MSQDLYRLAAKLDIARSDLNRMLANISSEGTKLSTRDVDSDTITSIIFTVLYSIEREKRLVSALSQLLNEIASEQKAWEVELPRPVVPPLNRAVPIREVTQAKSCSDSESHKPAS